MWSHIIRITEMPARAPSRHSPLAATTRARLVSPGAARLRDPGPSQAAPPDSATLPDVREALDALRHIVQSLRVGRAGADRGGLSSAQLFALQQIAQHPTAPLNDLAPPPFPPQSSVSVVIQRLVERGLVGKVLS